MVAKFKFFLICTLIGVWAISCKQSTKGGAGSSLNAINFESPSGLDAAVKKKAEKYDDLKVVGFALSLRGFKKDSTVSESDQDAICNFPALPSVKNSEDMCDAKDAGGKKLPPDKPGGEGKPPIDGDKKAPPGGPGDKHEGGSGVPHPPEKKGDDPTVKPNSEHPYYELEEGKKDLAKIDIKAGFEQYCATLTYYCTSKDHSDKPVVCLAHPWDQKKAPCGKPEGGKVKIKINVNWTKEFGGDVEASGLTATGSGDFVEVSIETTIDDGSSSSSEGDKAKKD